MAVFDFFKEDINDPMVGKLQELPVADIIPNPNQPRSTFDDESIAELAQSISQVGLIQPLVVRPARSGYELIAGERRLRAVKQLKMQKVLCIVREEVHEESSALIALIENLQREDLSYLEEAECYSALLETYNLTQEELARRVGKSQSSIANKLRILKLPPAVKTAMVDGGLTERHARALIKLGEEKLQLDTIRKISEKGLSVKETEAYVEKTLDKLYDEKADGAKPRPIIVRLVKDYRLFMNSVNTAVNQLRDSGMPVEVEQTETDSSVDIHIRIRRPI